MKQGCPLSPIVFSLCTAPIMDLLSEVLTNDELQALFADDIALVVQDLLRSAPALHSLFASVAHSFGLRLDTRKCVVVPLRHSWGSAFRTLWQEQAPQWGAFRFERSAKYLGFVIGPEEHAQRWLAAVTKYREEGLVIRNTGLGIAISLLAFRMLAVSVLGYLMQLSPPRAWDSEQEFAVRQFLPGPHRFVPWQWSVESSAEFTLPINMARISEEHLAASCITLASTRSEPLTLCAHVGRNCEPLAHPWRIWRMEAVAVVLHRAREEVSEDPALNRLESQRAMPASSGRRALPFWPTPCFCPLELGRR